MNSPLHTPEDDDITRLGPRQVFRSAEQVALEVPIAGPTSRILAYAIDVTCVLALSVGLAVTALLTLPGLERLFAWAAPLLPELESQEGVDAYHAIVWLFLLLTLGLFFIEWLYFVVVELATGGSSIGKALLGLRVRRDGGLPVTPAAVVMRNVLRAVDVLPVYYLTGLTSMILSRSSKRLGDHAAGTIVIRLDRPAPAPPLAPPPDDPDFRFQREQLARVDADARTLLRQTLRRLDDLDGERRAEVTGRTAEALRQRIGFRALAGGEAERFLRALLAALR